MKITMKYSFRSLMIALPLLLFSCGEIDLNPAERATFPSSVSLIVPSDKEVYLYTDANSTTVYPMLVGEKMSLGYSLNPDSVTFNDVVWTSSDKEVASVDANGVVTAISTGSTIITVTPEGAYSGSGISSTLKIVVSSSLTDAQSITLSSTGDSIYEGETTTITPIILPSSATYRSVRFTSSDESVATINNKGVVTGVSGSGDGKVVTIKATALDNSGIIVSKDITVLEVVQPQSITLDKTYSKDNYDWAIADKGYTISYATIPSNSTKSLIQWTSSDPAIATVANGVVTFNQNGVFGNVTITAACPETGSSDQVTLNLAEGLIRELYHNPNNITWDLTAAHKSNGGKSVWSYGKLDVTTYKVNTTTQRGDFAKTTASVWLHAGNYPYFVIKMTDVLTDYASQGVTGRNIVFDAVATDNTLYNAGLAGNNKWTTRYKCSDGSYAFIYNLATGFLSNSSVVKFNTMQLKYADIKTIATPVTYSVYWVQTFKSLDALKAYLTSEGLTWTE